MRAVPLSDDPVLQGFAGLTLAQVLSKLNAAALPGKQWTSLVTNFPDYANMPFSQSMYQLQTVGRWRRVILRNRAFFPYAIYLTVRPDETGIVEAAQLVRESASILDIAVPIIAGILLGPNLLVQMVGQTALNGGNLEAAAKSVLFGAVGGVVGSQAADVLSSDLAGKIAGSAAASMLGGKNIEDALKSAFIGAGASAVGGAAGDFVADVIESAPSIPVVDQPPTTPIQGEQAMSPFDDFGNFSSNDFAFNAGDPLAQFAALDLNIAGDMFGNIANPLQDFAYDDMDFTDYADAAQLPVIDPSSGTAFQIDPAAQNPQAFFSDARYDASHGIVPAPLTIAAENYSDADMDYGPSDTQPASNVVQMANAAVHFSDARYDAQQGTTPASAPVPGAVPPASAPYTFAQGLRDATAVALSAISVSQAYTNARRPASVPAGSKTSASGNTVTGQADGNVTVRTPTGQVSVQRPPIGVPYVTADGGAVVNNGDGTYTYASPAGATVTRPYKSASKGIDAKTLAIGAGVVGALLLLSR